MNNYETQYKILVNRLLFNGKKCESRAGDVIADFGQSIGADMTEGFPVLTSRKIFFEKALAEFRWMYLGKTDLEYLNDRGITWWNEYAMADGKLGKIYGYQIRQWNGCLDQVEFAHNELINNSRRAIITFWNPSDLASQSLPPCYTTMTFVRIGGELHMEMSLRSSDVSVGLPYDMIIGALFLHEMAAMTNLIPRYLKLNLANAHIYLNNRNASETYLAQAMHDLPNFDGIGKLIDYEHEKHIPFVMNG